MPHKHPYRVRVVRIDIEDVRLAKEIGEQQIVLAAVPFATDPADAIHQPQGREFGDDKILGSFTVELEQVALVDPEIRYLRPELFDGQRWNLDAEISVPWLERVPNVRNLIGDQTVRDRER